MKRGQLSIFIIAGLLVVLAVGTIIYLNAQRTRSVSIPQAEQVAEAAVPFQDYVNACIDRVSREGLQDIGDHGGYLNTASVPNIKLNRAEPTESGALYLAPDGDYGVPYWWFMKSPNGCTTCEFASQEPALYERQERDGVMSIEGQLAKYVQDNLANCLKDFEPFKAQGFTVTSKKGTARAVVTDDDVVVGLEQEFSADREGEHHTLHRFAVTLPVHLKELYQLAENITRLEADNSYLARHAKNIIVAYGRKDSNALPPLSDTTFELGAGVTWVKYNVQQRVQELLQEYVPLLQVFGTRSYHPLHVPDGIQNADTVKNTLNRDALVANLKPFPHTEARFTYLDAWKPYIDLNCDGQVCQSENFINTFIMPFGIQRYTFAYDVSYPVLVQLREPDALNGKGYTFTFALESNLRNNEPVDASWEEFSVPQPAGVSLLCNLNQRTSGVVNLTLTDSVTNKPTDANINFQCGDESCVIGSTENGKLSTRLPRCAGGVLTTTQTDYLGAAYSLNTNTEDNHEIALSLNPILRVNVTLRKIQLRKDPATSAWNLGDEPIRLGQYDQGIITLTRHAAPGEEQFSSFAGTCGSSQYRDQLDKDVRITPGTYSVQITTLYHANITIPPDRRTIDRGPFKSDKVYYVPPQAITFGNNTGPCVSEKPFPTGSINFNWTVTPEDLRNGHNLYFSTIVMGAELPGTRLVVEDLNQLTSMQTYVDVDYSLVQPQVLS